MVDRMREREREMFPYKKHAFSPAPGEKLFRSEKERGYPEKVFVGGVFIIYTPHPPAYPKSLNPVNFPCLNLLGSFLIGIFVCSWKSQKFSNVMVLACRVR
jgi:hypothetical protein